MGHSFLIPVYVVFFIGVCSSNNAVVVQGFTAPSKSQSKAAQQQNQNDDVLIASKNSKSPKQHIATTYNFSVPLSNPRPKPQSFTDKFKELWNDPRPISAVLADTDSSSVVGRIGNTDIPYCIVSDEFNIDINEEGEEAFQILLYPRGRFVGSDDATATTSSSSSSYITGSASAYLRYLPKQYGDEVDIAWKLRLKTIDNDEPLSIITSGGLPKSNTTWSAAMTLCVELESSESVGRAQDWGSSTWSANEVCNALGNLKAEGEITIFEKRHGESSFTFPPKGAVGAVLSAAQLTSSKSADDGNNSSGRVFRAGEVIVPRNTPGFEKEVVALRKQFIYPGVDYRIMSMTDKDGLPIFSTDSIDNDEDRRKVRLALRPCGWKLQQQLWKRDGVTDWPMEVEAGVLSTVAASRFDIGSGIPRIISAFQRDPKLYTLSLAIALTPIPLALIARNFISFYVIPSASMEPTLLRGDLLVVEKIDTTTKRGDVVLFQPPDTLRDIITNNGSQLSSTSLFVKRVVGLPGDSNISLDDDGNVQINGKSAVGPDRSLCTEPLRLIDKQLRDGKGKELRELGPSDVYVLGDCKAVSIDSRVWGALPKEKIKGKPIARIWPLSRFKLTVNGQL